MIYKVRLSKAAFDDIKKFRKAGNKPTLEKIDTLLEELKNHPRTGTGKPKPLKHLPGFYSRRITKKHRLLYSINDREIIVLVISVSGHYDDK